MAARRTPVVLVFDSVAEAAEALDVTTGAVSNARTQGYRLRGARVLKHVPRPRAKVARR